MITDLYAKNKLTSIVMHHTGTILKTDGVY